MQKRDSLREILSTVPKDGFKKIVTEGKFSIENLDEGFVRVRPVDESFFENVQNSIMGSHPVIVEYVDTDSREVKCSKKFENGDYEVVREWLENEI